MTLTLRVYGLAGEALCSLPAERDWTLRDAKVAVQRAGAGAWPQQRLLIGTVEPGDCDRLADFVPHGGSCLEATLVRRPPEQAEWLSKVEAEWRSLRRAPHHVRADRDVILRAVEMRGRALRYAAAELRADRDVVLAAVRQEGDALQYAAPQLKADRDIVLLAVSRSPSSLLHAADELQRDRDFVLKALKADSTGSLLRYTSHQMRMDRELVLAAVRRTWCALEHIPQAFLSDSEVVNAAVMQNLEALKYVAATVGLQQGVPPGMLELCRGRRSEFGAKVILQNELCTATEDGSSLRGQRARSVGSSPLASSRSATPCRRLTLGRVPTPVGAAASSRSSRGTMRVLMDGGLRVVAAGGSRASSCGPAASCGPAEPGGALRRPRTPPHLPRPRSSALPRAP